MAIPHTVLTSANIVNRLGDGLSWDEPNGLIKVAPAAADPNDTIANAAGTDAALIDAIRDELHDLKDKLRAAKIVTP